MGISGLFGFLSKCVHPGNLNDFHGKTVAIDMPCWIHRAAISDAQNIALKTNEKETNKKINEYIEKRLNLVINKGITPIAVFDGKKLKAKKETNEKRRNNRDAALDRAREALRSGDTNKAYSLFCQAIKIPPEMNEAVKRLCQRKNIQVITSPYEADAQLAYLSKAKYVTAVISEDSDLVIYGVNHLLTKLQDDGQCQHVNGTELSRVTELECFTREKLLWLRYACIMQGCDYYPSGLKGIGLKKAIQILKKAYEDKKFTLEEIMQNKKKYATENATKKWTPEDIQGIIVAEQGFRYQLILNVKKNSIEPLEPYPFGQTENDFPHCGTKADHDITEKLSLNKENEPVQKKKEIPFLIQPKSRPQATPPKPQIKVESKKRVRSPASELPVKKRQSTGIKIERNSSVMSDHNDSSGSELEFEKHIKRELIASGKKTKVQPKVQVKSSYWKDMKDSSESDDDDGIFAKKPSKPVKNESMKSVFDDMATITQSEPKTFDSIFIEDDASKTSSGQRTNSQQSNGSSQTKSPVFSRKSQKKTLQKKPPSTSQKQSKISSFFKKQ